MESWLVILLLLALGATVAAVIFDRNSRADADSDSLAAFFAEGVFMVAGVVQLFLGLALALTVAPVSGIAIALMGCVLLAVVIRQIRRKQVKI